jgi:arylformamidase
MARYLDISIPTSSRTTVFPGDPSPQIHWPHWAIEKGDPASVGFFNGGLHHGTHVDAPWHFNSGAKQLHEMPLDRWLGPCWVADLTAEPQCVSAAALQKAGIPPDTKRLLLKTRNGLTDYWNRPWNPNFIYIHRSAAEWCVQHGLWTVGLDYLTIDSPEETEFPSHRTLLGNEVVIIENLNLRDIPAGPYELLAAPVNLVGADGAWCRALLRVES